MSGGSGEAYGKRLRPFRRREALHMVLAGALAAVERLLTLRNNRVLDVETLWTNF